MSIERRLEKLEDYEERKDQGGKVHTILKVCTDGVRKPTEEEVEAVKTKFLEEHPNHKRIMVLDFQHLDEYKP